MNETNVQAIKKEKDGKKLHRAVGGLKSERVQDLALGLASRLKSERVQTTVITAEVAVASQGVGGFAPATRDEVTVKIAGRRRVRTGLGETVTDFAVKVN